MMIRSPSRPTHTGTDWREPSAINVARWAKLERSTNCLISFDRETAILFSFFRLGEPINEGRDISCPKSVIDIHHADVRGAGIHHSQQRGYAFERSAVANTGRYGDHGNAYQSADHT